MDNYLVNFLQRQVIVLIIWFAIFHFLDGDIYGTKIQYYEATFGSIISIGMLINELKKEKIF